MPELPLAALVLLIATGLFITDRVNKIPLAQAFLGTYFLLFTVWAFAGDPGHVAAMFRPPNLHMALYFAFFILMPWYTKADQTKPVPERVTYHAH